MSPAANPIELTVIGGFLGAGKTTLLNALLRDAGGRRLAVVVNDFGAINIDAELVESRDGAMVRLENGCICCSIGSDFIGALALLRDGPDPPAHVVVEASGVADPGAIAVLGDMPGYRRDAAVVLADRSDLGTLELRGSRSLLDRALADRLGDPPPAAGTARRQHGVWYLRLDTRRTLIVGAHGVLSGLAPLGSSRDRADLVTRDIGDSIAGVSIIGPRAARLLTAAGLPGDLEIGAIGRDPADANVMAILRESQRSVLILVRAPAIDAFLGRLLPVGEPLGAAMVGCDALALLAAASTQALV